MVKACGSLHIWCQKKKGLYLGQVVHPLMAGQGCQSLQVEPWEGIVVCSSFSKKIRPRG